MENMKRNIRLFFVSYGSLLFQIIAIILLIIFGVQALNNKVIEKNAQYQEKETTKEESIIDEEKEIEKQKEDEKYIAQFIEYCNSGNTEESYNMLSKICKKERFPTKNEFVKYINEIYSIKIYDYRILEKEDIYTIQLMQDPIATGKQESFKVIKCKIVEELMGDKLYIYRYN